MILFDKIAAKEENSYAMILFNGFGGNKDSLKSLLNVFNFKKNISYFLLEAPYKVDNNAFSWSYEIKEGVWERDEPKLLLNDFFNKIIFTKYSHKNVFLLGFSQGAFICFEYGLNIKGKIGGIFPIAGFTSKSPKIHKTQIETPLIIGHGLDDKVIDKSSSENAYNYYSKIKKMNNVNIITYKGGHKISLGYLKAINKFMKNNNIR